MLLTFLLLLLFSNGLTIRPDTAILYSRIGILIVFYSVVALMTSFHITYLEKGIGLYGGLFNVNCITHSFQIFILVVCGLILMFTAFYPRKKYIDVNSSLMNSLLNKPKQYINVINKASEQFTIIEYALIMIFVITGALLLITSADLGSIYLCIELQSFSLYIISSMHRNSESSTGSALTYFLLGGLSSCFILLGIALIYANSGLTNLDGIYSIISDSERYVYYSTWYLHTYIFYCLLLISVGLLFKIAAAPFHWWSPDVYDGVPTIVTTFIAIMGKIAILILFLELVHNTNTLLYTTVQTYSWTTSLTISCFFSLIIGTLLGLTQTRIKKLLAYSTISHVGFILLALVTHNSQSYQAFLFYIIQYILTNLNAFFILIAIGFSLYLYYTNISEYNRLPEKNNSPIQLIRQLKGYYSTNPILALCFIIVFFSFVGLPPLVGFFGKQMVLTAALDNYKDVLVIIAILTSVIGAVYYLNVIKTVYFRNSDYETFNMSNVSISNVYSIIIGLLSLLTVLFILIPDQLMNLMILIIDIYVTTLFETHELNSWIFLAAPESLLDLPNLPNNDIPIWFWILGWGFFSLLFPIVFNASSSNIQKIYYIFLHPDPCYFRESVPEIQDCMQYARFAIYIIWKIDTIDVNCMLIMPHAPILEYAAQCFREICIKHAQFLRAENLQQDMEDQGKNDLALILDREARRRLEILKVHTVKLRKLEAIHRYCVNPDYISPYSPFNWEDDPRDDEEDQDPDEGYESW